MVTSELSFSDNNNSMVTSSLPTPFQNRAWSLNKLICIFGMSSAFKYFWVGSRIVSVCFVDREHACPLTFEKMLLRGNFEVEVGKVTAYLLTDYQCLHFMSVSIWHMRMFFNYLSFQ